MALSRLLRGLAPSGLAPLYAAVTALGGTTFLMVALASLYWAWDGRRREVALVVSFAFVALSATVALKTALALPRPPLSVRSIPVSDPYGFPSGHAVAATVVYGGLVRSVDRLRDRRWALLAAALVALVALSRVVLGVHYLGDVLAGIGLGVVLLVILRRLADGDPARGFAVAALVSVAAVLVAGTTSHATLALGGSLGGVLGSRGLEGSPGPRSKRRLVGVLAVGLAFLVGMRALAGAVENAAAAAAVVDLLLVAGVLSLPAAVDRVLRDVRPALS
ncbi:MAG: phosphatase PAP2 family protein [Salinigranum sp.]